MCTVGRRAVPQVRRDKMLAQVWWYVFVTRHSLFGLFGLLLCNARRFVWRQMHVGGGRRLRSSRLFQRILVAISRCYVRFLFVVMLPLVFMTPIAVVLTRFLLLS